MKRLLSLMVAVMLIPSLAGAQARIGAHWDRINVFGIARAITTNQDTICGNRCAGGNTIAASQSIVSQSFQLAGASDVFVIVTDSTGTGTTVVNLYCASDSSFGAALAASDSVTSADTLVCNPRVGICAINRGAASAKNPQIVRFTAEGAGQQVLVANGPTVEGYNAKSGVVGVPWGKVRVAVSGTAISRGTIRILVLYPYGKPDLPVVQGL